MLLNFLENKKSLNFLENSTVLEPHVFSQMANIQIDYLCILETKDWCQPFSCFLDYFEYKIYPGRTVNLAFAKM